MAGIIEGKDLFHAYKKLRLKHRFDVHSISPRNTTEDPEAIKNQVKSLEEKLKEESQFINRLSKLRSADFFHQIIANIEDPLQIKQDNLTIQQKKILKKIIFLFSIKKKIGLANERVGLLIKGILSKMCPFLFFSSSLFALLIMISSLSIVVLQIGIPTHILENETFRLSASFSVVGFLVASIDGLLFRKRYFFLTYLGVLVWFFGTLILFYNL